MNKLGGFYCDFKLKIMMKGGDLLRLIFTKNDSNW
ncbi:MAG: hypothetical protein ACJASU_002525 [Cognaticolwellia sp.]|jgi:hypothetical protein